MKAIVNYEKKPHLRHDRDVPKLRDDYVLVKTVAIALNPTDWKHSAFGFAPEGGLLGCDFAGIVEEVGSAVTKPWKKGDRICGVAHGGNLVQPEDGAFAEYIIAKGDVQMKIPDRMSFEEAATIPLGASTVGQGLYQKALKLSLPNEPIQDGGYVLIYGGSSATGALGIQYAKLSGYKVITTCSPKNFSYVRSLGAEEAFDYNDPQSASKIREYTNGQLKFAWDTISEKKSADFCANALSLDAGCKYGAILSMTCPRDDVESASTLMYTIFNEAFEIAGMKIPALPEDYEFAKTFMGVTETLMAEGKLKPHAVKVGKEGLRGALEGLEELKSGNVSGNKLVYLVAETP